MDAPPSRSAAGPTMNCRPRRASTGLPKARCPEIHAHEPRKPNDSPTSARTHHAIRKNSSRELNIKNLAPVRRQHRNRQRISVLSNPARMASSDRLLTIHVRVERSSPLRWTAPPPSFRRDPNLFSAGKSDERSPQSPKPLSVLSLRGHPHPPLSKAQRPTQQTPAQMTRTRQARSVAQLGRCVGTVPLRIPPTPTYHPPPSQFQPHSA